VRVTVSGDFRYYVASATSWVLATAGLPFTILNTVRLMRIKAMPMDDDRRRELIQQTILGSLNRAKESIARIETADIVALRLN
jgi:hypothetical protein